MPSPDDERLGRLFRKLRRKAGLTQEQLAKAARVSVEEICDIESGRVGHVRIDRVRAGFHALDGRLYLNPWWRGASADRLLDEEHAAIVEVAAGVFNRRGWRTSVEMTFAERGERGSIDLFAAYHANRAVAVCEIKSAFGSLEQTNRALDAKVRLAPELSRRTFGWAPRHVARLLIVPNLTAVRRVVQDHAETMAAIYPERSRSIRAWLRNPTRSLSGIWFVSIPALAGTETA